LSREHPATLGELLLADVAKAGARSHPKLDDAVEEARGVPVCGRGVVLPYLRLGALLEDDQGAPVEGAPRGLLEHGQPDRLGEALPARHVDEDAVSPVRLVAGHEGILGRDEGAEALVDDVAETLGGLPQREYHGRPVGRVGARGDPLDHALGGLVGVEVKVGEVRELPALDLVGGEGELTR
jgi:hypothetical protein